MKNSMENQAKIILLVLNLFSNRLFKKSNEKSLVVAFSSSSLEKDKIFVVAFALMDTNICDLLALLEMITANEEREESSSYGHGDLVALLVQIR
jgi:hypothetical protein